MSKNYLRGSKRLAVIQNWLNGKEDDEWEVLPTKKDGKYIVKKRQNLKKDLPKSNDNFAFAKVEHDEDDEDDEDEQIENVDENEQDDDNDDEPPPPPPKRPKKYIPLDQPSKYKAVNTSFDPTINIQILEQLKSLGNELKYEREKKQQKQLIKHQINKQLNNQQNHMPMIYEPEPQAESEPQIQPRPQIQKPQRRRLDLRNI